MESKEETNREIETMQKENRRRLIMRLNNLMAENPALKKLANFFRELSEDEQESIFMEFDSHEFLAYDLFGAILNKEI